MIPEDVRADEPTLERLERSIFPGGALEDENGIRMPPQWIAIGRLGLLF